MHPSAILIVEVILKGTAILLAGYGGAALLAKSSAAHRSCWWLGVFTTLLLLPLAFAVRPLWTLPVHTEVRQAEIAPALPVAVSPSAVRELNAPIMESPIVAVAPVLETSQLSRPSSRPYWSLGEWLFVAYACGVAVVLGFRFLGAGQLWRLRRGSVADAEAQAVIERWRRSVGLRRGVQVYCDARVTVPMTWGVWHPVILLPEHRGARTKGDLHAALQHEFAHIRHHDAARRWLGTIVAALWWPHPLVWLAGRAWKLEQERACDDAVLTHGGDAASYAQQLLGAAGRVQLSGTQSAAALIMAGPAGLETRLRSVMSETVDRSPARRGALLRIGAFTVMATLCGLAFQARSVAAAPPAATGADSNAIQKKAEETIIPKFAYFETTPAVALQAISKAVGVRISYTPRPDDRANLTLALTNVPAAEVLKYVAQLACLKVTYQADGIAVLAEKVTLGGSTALEEKAKGIEIPKLTFNNATPAEVLKALSAASGIKAVYTPAEWDQPNQTFSYPQGGPAWGLFQDFSQRANLYMTYREDAIYFAANPYARNGFKTLGTVEYTAEMTTIPLIDWKGIKPAEAFKEIAAASGIKIFYTPRSTDKPALPEKLSNASVAFLVGIVAEPAGLRISYEAEGIHLTPGDPLLNWEHSQARLRTGLPTHRDLLLEASPEYKAAIKQRLDATNAWMQEKYKKATLVKVGDRAPDFTCRTVAGEEFTLSRMTDKVIVLHFVSGKRSWDALQKFEQEALQKHTGRTDMQSLAIITSNVTPSRLEELVKERKVSSPIAGDPKKEIFSKYGSDYGRTYIIGKDGKVKQCLFPSLVQGKAGYEFEFTAFVQALTQALQKELAANP